MSQVTAGAGEVTPFSPPIPDVTEPEDDHRSGNEIVQQWSCQQNENEDEIVHEWSSEHNENEVEQGRRKEPGWFSRRVVAPTFRRVMRRREEPGVIDDQVHPMISCPRLYISSICAALNWKALEQAGITHILVLGPQQLPKRVLACFKGPVCYKVYLFPDDPSYELMDALNECLPFIKDTLSNSWKNKILVHCNAGHSRSATVCCAFLMQENKYSLDQALDDLRLSRPLARPNAGFMRQLRELESWLLETN